MAEFLPIESADMSYMSYDNHITLCPYNKMINDGFDEDEVIPCWSLAALLDVLPYKFVDNHYLTLYKEDSKEYCCCCEDVNGNGFGHHFADKPIDVCYEMILKLHELKML